MKTDHTKTGLTKEEALKAIDQLIQKKVRETGKTYFEVSREMLHKLQEKKSNKE